MIPTDAVLRYRPRNLFFHYTDAMSLFDINFSHEGFQHWLVSPPLWFNISTTLGWTVMRFGSDIHDNFGDPFLSMSHHHHQVNIGARIVRILLISKPLLIQLIGPILYRFLCWFPYWLTIFFIARFPAYTQCRNKWSKAFISNDIIIIWEARTSWFKLFTNGQLVNFMFEWTVSALKHTNTKRGNSVQYSYFGSVVRHTGTSSKTMTQGVSGFQL